MKTTEITLLKKGVNSDINILEPEAQENILGGASKCDQGYRHSIFYGTKCDCGYDNGHISNPSTSINTEGSTPKP